MARHRRPALPAVALAIAAAVAAMLSPLLAPLPASAQEIEVLDAHDDYWHDHRADGDTPDQHEPDWGDPDIRRTVYRHWHDRVSVRIKLDRVASGDAGYWEVEVRLRTNEGLRRTATWFKPSDGPPTIDWSGPGQCAIDGHIDFSADAFVVDVPRSCLSAPKRVAFKSATRWWPTSDDVAYLDVSGFTGYRLRHWSAAIPRG